jgi:hypothetical protein
LRFHHPSLVDIEFENPDAWLDVLHALPFKRTSLVHVAESNPEWPSFTALIEGIELPQRDVDIRGPKKLEPSRSFKRLSNRAHYHPLKFIESAQPAPEDSHAADAASAPVPLMTERRYAGWLMSICPAVARRSGINAA